MLQSNYKQPAHSRKIEKFNHEQLFALAQRMIQRKSYDLPSVKQRLRWSRRLANTAAGTMLLFGSLAPIAQAGTITVDSDTITATTADCDLVAAIITANNDSTQDGCTILSGATGAADTILLNDRTFSLYSSQGNYDGPTGLPSITSDMTLSGGPAGSTIQRDPAASQPFRIFHIDGGGQLILSNVTLQGGETTSRGGAIYVKDGGVIALNQGSLISGNRAAIGGGISARQNSQVELTDSAVNNNIATDFGGGLYVAQSSTATLINSTLANNQSQGTTYGGGGLYLYDQSTATLDQSVVMGNSAYREGGGLLVSKASQATLTDSQVSQNRANAGAGLHLYDDSQATINDSQISQNSAESLAGGLYVTENSVATIAGTTLSSNRALEYGGGLYVVDSAVVTVSNSQLLNNQAGADGGALMNQGGTVAVSQSCIVGNSITAIESDVPMNAMDNWWGLADGPSEVGPGAGDSLNTNVQFTPFLATAISGCTSISAALDVTKSVTPTILAPGDLLTYTITIANVGNADILGIAVADTLPDHLTLIGTITVDPTSASISAGPFLLQGLDLGQGEQVQILLPVQLSLDVPLGSVITNTVSASSAILTPTSDSAPIYVITPTPTSTHTPTPTPTPTATPTPTPQVLLENSAPVVPESVGFITLNVLLYPGTVVPVHVQFGSLIVLPDYAVAGIDYTIPQPVLTFDPGETHKAITVTIQDDLLDEANERFRLVIESVTGGNAAIAQQGAETQITILDDDPATITPSPTATATATATVTATATPSPTAMSTSSHTPTNAPTSTPVNTAVPTSTASPTASLTATSTSTPTFTPSPTTTPTRTSTATPTISPVPSHTSTSMPSSTATPIPTASPSSTVMPTETTFATQTSDPTKISTVTSTEIPTVTPTVTPAITQPQTATPTATSLPTMTQVPTNTLAPIPTSASMPTFTSVPTLTATSTAEPAKLVGEIEPLETTLEPNSQVRYDMSIQNIGGSTAENVIVEIQLPAELTLAEPQLLPWRQQSEGVYQLDLGTMSRLAVVQNFIVVEIDEAGDESQVILTPALRLYADGDVEIFQLAAGSGANVTIRQVDGAQEDPQTPTDLSNIEEPHRTIQFFLPIIVQ